MAEISVNRTADNWAPLLTIATVVGGQWLDKAKKAALALSRDDSSESSRNIELLADIRTIFEDEDIERISSEGLVIQLNNMPDRPWADYRKGKGLNQHGLSTMLRSFGIKPKTIRMEDKTPRGYVIGDFADSWLRYLDKPQQAQQTNKNEGLGIDFDPQQRIFVANGKVGLSTSKDSDVADVAVQRTGWEAELE